MTEERSRSPPGDHGQLPVIGKAYDFLLWLIPWLDKLPRNRRFTLGERMEQSALDVLLTLVEAAYTRDKTPLLWKGNRELERLRYLLRLTRDLGLLSAKRHTFASGKVDEIGQMIGGWLKQQRRRH